MILARYLQIFSLIFSIFFSSCVTNSNLTSFSVEKFSKEELISQTNPYSLFTSIPSEKLIRKKLVQFQKALKKGKLSAQDWKLHDELLDYYIYLKKRNNNKIIVPSHSRVTYPFETYCLNPSFAAPDSNEVYDWQKGVPSEIPYYSELLSLRRSDQITQRDLQELLWSLKNKTEWEQYPDNFQNILKKIDPQAPLKLPSHLKNKTKNLIENYIINQLPSFSESSDNVFNLIEGKYYDFKDIDNSLENLKSHYELNHNGLTKIPDSHIYSESKSESYSRQEITFYNNTNKSEVINLNNYYLAPERKDVQRIALNALPEQDPLLEKDLEKTLYGMDRLGIGLIPIVHDVADLYELLTGKDFVSGRNLSFSDRLLSGVGVIVGSGAEFRFAKKALFAPESELSYFSRDLSLAANKEVQISKEEISAAQSSFDESQSLYSEVLNTPQGSRPDPETYLSKDFIDSHLKQFDNGASFLITKESLDQYGREFIGHPDNTRFVLTKSEMDELLKKTKDNIPQIETELGISAGDWQGQELIRVDVPNPRDLGLRMPSGNERGANHLWLPGGKTPNGWSEAVLNKVPKEKYIERGIK